MRATSVPNPGLAGQVALVTGGSRGIGEGIARALASAGAKVIVTGRADDALRGVVGRIAADGGTAMSVVADLTQEADLLALRDRAEKAFGIVTLLAACAGGGGRPRPIVDEELGNWNRTLEANLATTFLTLRTFLPPMLELRQGSIVTMASAAGRQPAGASAPYSAAKAGVIALTRQAALEAAAAGVRVNAVAPYTIATERVIASAGSHLAQMQDSFPLKSLGTPDDVAEATLFLLSDAARWISGITLDVAGGKITL